MFNRALYSESLHTKWLGKPFHYLEKTESTNTILKQTPSDELLHGTVLLADEQCAGRGQKKRKWISEPGKNLTFTIALFPPLPDPPGRLTLLSLIAGYGIVKALRARFRGDYYLKWPNDIMIGQRKLGGILTETIFYGSQLDRVLIGIGLNVNQKQFPADLGQACSLAGETGSEICREELLPVILSEIEESYGRWNRCDPSLIPEINAAVDGVGEWVRISVNGSPTGGHLKFLGVDGDGRLLFLSQEFDVITYTHEQIHILGPDKSGRESH